MDFDPDLGLNAYMLWRMSNSPTPPTLEDMLDRDPAWDAFIRQIGTLVRFQEGGFGDKD